MLSGRSALITGSTQGIGLATAKTLAVLGCNVMLNGFGEAAVIEHVRSEIESHAMVCARYHGADVSKQNEIEDLYAATAKAFGAVDIVVNNAVSRSFAPLEQFPPDRWQMGLDVNLSAAFHLGRLALGGMRQRNWGRIVNLSSGFGLIGAPGRIDYITTKTGLIGLTRAIAMEVLDTGITCNAVCPGATFTPRQEGKIEALMREGLDREAALTRIKHDMAVERFISPDSVAAVIAFLCSDAARDINGVALPVDGGFTAGAMLRDPNWQGTAT